MAIYIDPAMVPDLDNIDSRVFKYLIQKHKGQLARWAKCKDYYEGRHDILAHKVDDDDDVVRFNVNYAKYVVDVGLGYYLGEPVKYNSDKADKADKQRKELEGGVKASIKNGSVKLYDPDLSQKLDISRIQDVYDNETISEIDSKIGKAIGIYGEAYEQLYANSDENPEPRSTVVNPMNCIMVRDNTVEHNKLFAIIYEIQEDLNESKYYSITVCNDHNTKEYRSRDLDNFEFYLVEGSEQEHYFGEVPVVEYQNNDERQGDFEQIIPMQDALNELFSDRVTDKKKFVNSILAMFGMTLDDDDEKELKKNRFIDGLPLDGKIEYIDARKQIKELLESIEYNELKVKHGYPKSISYVPLVTFIQIANTGTGMHSVVENLGFQIDIWSRTFKECISIMLMVDEKMVDLGFNRDYESPDDDGDNVDASGYCRKTLRYSSKVDTRTNRLIS